MRLLFCNVITGTGEPAFKKAELIRVPLRLGEDSFIKGKITPRKEEKLVTTMKAFRYLIDAYDAVDYRACATSAMRDAVNSWDIIHRIRKEAGLKVEIIDGKTEADIIYSNHIAEFLDKGNSYLYIDVGGGSTEITLFAKGKVVASQSFNIGTIRMLHAQVEKEYWNYFKKWVREVTAGYKPLVAIGSGGNINKIFKMLRRKEGKPLSVNKLRGLYELLDSYSYEDRMKKFGLNPDRADVIMPAARIFLSVMKNAEIEKIYVPEIGLSDGIVHQLFEKYRHKMEAKSLS